jgi:hypothetical protein
MKKLILVMILTILGSIPVMAQENGVPKAEVFTGYSYLRTERGTNLNGFDFSVTGNVNKNFGITGEFGGLYGRSFVDSAYTFMAGPRLSARTGNVTPFVHALVGGIGVPVEGEAGFATALGGGVDVRVNDRISIRAIQADYLLTRLFNNTQHNARLSFGVIFNFGKR